MNNFFEEMKAYLENTPRAEIEKTWAKYNIPENEVGPTMEVFLKEAMLYHCRSQVPYTGLQNSTNTNFSPNYTSGFFLTKILNQYANSSSFFNHQLSI